MMRPMSHLQHEIHGNIAVIHGNIYCNGCQQIGSDTIYEPGDGVTK